jgi:8-oxo-dGTP pyrophosphatase MutT (NUDIX family)
MPDTTFFVAYASSATEPFSRDKLTSLLTQSRARNGSADVTGLLLYRGGNFLQALEGPEAAVRETMERIARDPRHRSIVELYDGDHDGRLFGDWQMGFEDASRLDPAAHPGLSEFLSRPDSDLAPEVEEHDVYEFFRTFRELIR